MTGASRRGTVLVTGGAGFIGSRLSLSLVSAGYHVKVLDVLAPQVHGADPDSSPLFRAIRDKVEFRLGSVTSRRDLMEVLPGCDAVVHLAAETGTGQSMYAVHHYAEVNVCGTALLLDLIGSEKLPVGKLVVASSRAVCGEGKYRCADHGAIFPSSRLAEDMSAGCFDVLCPRCRRPAELRPTDEETPVRPTSLYGITKLTQEQMVLTIGRALGISAVALRYQNVYGPGQSLSNPYTGILSIFSTRLRMGRGVEIFEDGLESRDFVYVDDVVDITRRAVEFEAPLQGVFNVGSGVATSVLSVAEALRSLLGCEGEIAITGRFRLGDVRHNVADLTKVRAALGFEPSVPIGEGLRRFVDWVRDEPLEVDRYEESLGELEAKGLLK
jgi:dTDP-L-rhamnose 4-epimerase